jgi:Holliday junction DNA helicase RuvB
MNRPKTFSEFQGQTNKETVERLRIAVSTAQKRNEVLNHVLLYGNAGLGKTTLSHIIANEMKMKLKVITGGTIKKPKDLVIVLFDMWEAQQQGVNQILFIDEIHCLSKSDIPEEAYYSLLEEYTFYHNLMGSEIKIGNRMLTMGAFSVLKPFTVIGATTAPGLLTKPLRDRFPISCFLKEYTTEDIRDVIKWYALAGNIQFEEDALMEIAQRARGNPRVGINFFRSVYDLITSKDEKVVNKEAVLYEMQLQHIDEEGLTDADLRILEVLAKSPKGLGVANLAGCSGIEKTTIEQLYEPHLKIKGYMETRHKRFIRAEGLELLRRKGILKEKENG